MKAKLLRDAGKITKGRLRSCPSRDETMSGRTMTWQDVVRPSAPVYAVTDDEDMLEEVDTRDLKPLPEPGSPNPRYSPSPLSNGLPDLHGMVEVLDRCRRSATSASRGGCRTATPRGAKVGGEQDGSQARGPTGMGDSVQRSRQRGSDGRQAPGSRCISSRSISGRRSAETACASRSVIAPGVRSADSCPPRPTSARTRRARLQTTWLRPASVRTAPARDAPEGVCLHPPH